MIDQIIEYFSSPRFIVAVLVCVAAVGTFYALIAPLFIKDKFDERLKLVASEREKIRARERSALTETYLPPDANVSWMKSIIELFPFLKRKESEGRNVKLLMAGFRNESTEVKFDFYKIACPIGLGIFSAFYIFVVLKLEYVMIVKLLIIGGAVFLGYKLPDIYISNIITKRQTSMRRAFPDALDLLLICVESGLSIEPAMQKVTREIASQSPELSEEFAITTAEMSFLPARRMAYENLVMRTGLDGVKSICMALIQAEKYGTNIGSALRAVSNEVRDERMQAAEKKAHSLPPKLTVPMIIFTLPVLFAVILSPAIMQISGLKK